MHVNEVKIKELHYIDSQSGGQYLTMELLFHVSILSKLWNMVIWNHLVWRVPHLLDFLSVQCTTPALTVSDMITVTENGGEG